MVEIGEVSEHGVRGNTSIGVIDDGLKQVAALSVSGSRNSSPLSQCGSRNTIPVGRTGSRNTCPCRQKFVKTKPRGLDEETVATFSKTVHSDVRTEDNIWAMLPEDLLNEILARVPPFLIFRLHSVCKRWN